MGCPRNEERSFFIWIHDSHLIQPRSCSWLSDVVLLHEVDIALLGKSPQPNCTLTIGCPPNQGRRLRITRMPSPIPLNSFTVKNSSASKDSSLARSGATRGAATNWQRDCFSLGPGRASPVKTSPPACRQQAMASENTPQPPPPLQEETPPPSRTSAVTTCACSRVSSLMIGMFGMAWSENPNTASRNGVISHSHTRCPFPNTHAQRNAVPGIHCSGLPQHKQHGNLQLVLQDVRPPSGLARLSRRRSSELAWPGPDSNSTTVLSTWK